MKLGWRLVSMPNTFFLGWKIGTFPISPSGRPDPLPIPHRFGNLFSLLKHPCIIILYGCLTFDGKSHNVAKDPWIHMNLNLDDRPLPPYISKVADLLVGHPPSWNAPLVRNLFHPSVTNLILKIQLHSSPSNVTDRQLWKPSKTGGFSVKSAYQVLLLERDKGSCSSSIGLRDLWKALWKYKGGILPRIKTFLWRCCFNDGMCNSQIPFTLD